MPANRPLLFLSCAALSFGCNAGEVGDSDIPAPAPDASDKIAACASINVEANLISKPVDIIFVIDNSGSMYEEIAGVEQSINDSFASIIEDSNLDYRVIMVAKHRPSATVNGGVCVEGPLSGLPEGGCVSPPTVPVNNPPKFYHYDSFVSSWDSWCRVMTGMSEPDTGGSLPNGIGEVLREDSFKTFVEFSDDRSNCSVNEPALSFNDYLSNPEVDAPVAAAAFDAALMQLSPEHFGTEDKRNYRWHSIVSIAHREPSDPSIPYSPDDAIQTQTCPGASTASPGHQALSQLTGGLRFSLCAPDYDVVFNELAAEVIDGALDCEFEVPEAPEGTQIDTNSASIEYSTDAGGLEQLTQVADVESCNAQSFYVDAEAGAVVLCSDTCDRVREAGAGALDIDFTCSHIIE